MEDKDIRKDIMGNDYYIEDGKVFVSIYRGFVPVSERDLFFDKEGNPCIGNSVGTCGRGSFATVYLCDDEEHCFKVFDDPKIDYVDMDVFKFLMSEDLPGIYHVNDFFYKKVGDVVRPAGYIMEFLPKADMKTFRMGGVDLLGKDSGYILESYERLSSSVFKLSQRGILMNDTEEYNATLEDNGIVLYDLDKFTMSNEPKEEIYMKNMKMLNGLMVSLITRSIFGHHSKDIDVEPISSYLEEVRANDGKVDFSEVFVSGEKALDSLSRFSMSRANKL